MKTKVVAMLLAGGRGSRLNLIASKRAKPAVPFAGQYRIIDFTLTNCMRSEVRHVGVLTQYRPMSLMEHLGDGEAWDMLGLNSTFSILPPSLGKAESDWYKGTAAAVWQNLDFLRHLKPTLVLILSGDHIYSMDYRYMIDFHLSKGADLTIAAMIVPWEECHRFGVMVTDKDSRVVRFVEKSKERISNLANMGVYVFNYDVLVEELEKQVPFGGYDFGANVIPSMVNHRNIFAFPFSGYWRDVGTIPSYWSANMDALDPNTGLNLRLWKVRTNIEGRGQIYHPPAWIDAGAVVINSIISRGCVIRGEVINSILSPGVYVSKGAKVFSSVVMHDCKIERGSLVLRSILDKDVMVGSGVKIGREDMFTGENRLYPTHLSGGLTVIGKGTMLEKSMIGANCLVGSGLSVSNIILDDCDSILA